MQAIGHDAIVLTPARFGRASGGHPCTVAVEDPDVQHCQVCGAQLTPQEMVDGLESEGPPLCAVHAAEELPELDEPPPLA